MAVLGFPLQSVLDLQSVVVREGGSGSSILFHTLDVGSWSYIHCTIKSTGSVPPPGDDRMVLVQFRWSSSDKGGAQFSSDEFIVPVSSGSTPIQMINVPVRARYLQIQGVSWPSPWEHIVEWSVSVSSKTLPMPCTPMFTQIMAQTRTVSTPAFLDVSRSPFVFYGRIVLTYRIVITSATDAADVRLYTFDRTGTARLIYQDFLLGIQNRSATIELPCTASWLKLETEKIGSSGVGDVGGQVIAFPSPSYGS